MIVTPKKFLGQHFLKDLDIARSIAESLEVSKPTKVLEIGPGMGVLTQFLLQNENIDLKVVELDRESVVYLKENFPALEGRIIEGDFLKMNLAEIYGDDDLFVIGNYPYNISSQIFFKVLENKDHIPCCSGMIQKEVAERIAARPGCKAYGILSVFLQAFYDIEYLFTVSEFVFDPPPKVKSAVIRMRRNSVSKLDCDEVLFVKVVKMSFNQRRKMMRNSLQTLLGKDNPVYQMPVFTKRPEQLSVADFVELTKLVDKHKIP
ncbi:MAG TPA: 16S rRNA (adenine(1518)-N(6)/adenine(1519)-N(6))-dimethyltransferase RsmA [Paludibacteraceae bacterium]|nr:16S rRNA (adenine(1518)-N(6)/adenine(1519)-N(6))-dimethyltransferase RsmA [Paludibacteraceae bacterium]HQF50290.1 16S rRNA (adenine(1518)-N(6)/adenine(1519)-N(6))-dimethyltransferase RsmA [Paludibacteraceae bacterium]HQJ90168.1 16S rRNA (adenine(1518)-N(6)/adenine(1519)-N(6))-dimethyltransferase RsmA [Paludibacteraceae bacterium]